MDIAELVQPHSPSGHLHREVSIGDNGIAWNSNVGGSVTSLFTKPEAIGLYIYTEIMYDCVTWAHLRNYDSANS